jgi:hypothetical protein
MLLLTLGSYGGIDVLLTHVPGIGSLRAPARYIVLVQLALVLLAAIAFDDLVGAPRPDRLTAGQTIALSSFAAAGILTTAAWSTQLVPAPSWLPVAPAMHAALGVAVVVAVTAAFLLAARRVSWTAPALIVLTALDLGCWGISYVYREQPRTIEEVTWQVPRASGPGIRVQSAPWWGNRLVLKDYQVVPGYLGLYPATANAPTSDRFRALGGAVWDVAGNGVMTALPDGKPRARLVDGSRHESVAGVQIALDDPGHIVVNTDGPFAATLALTERFDAGWRVSVDGAAGAPKDVEDFLGADLGPGRHRVEFRFDPRSFAVGEMVSVLGVLLLAGGLAVISSHRRL